MFPDQVSPQIPVNKGLKIWKWLQYWHIMLLVTFYILFCLIVREQNVAHCTQVTTAVLLCTFSSIFNMSDWLLESKSYMNID